MLVLSPVPGGALICHFLGPYVVDRKVSNNNCMNSTSNHIPMTRLCHENMLKLHDLPSLPSESLIPIMCTFQADDGLCAARVPT